MPYPIEFDDRARAEARKQAVYLEKQRPDYGRKFREVLQATIQSISEYPDRYASTIARPDLQVIRLGNPFHKTHSVYYKFDGKIVRVLCVFPNSRSEEIWQNRQ